LLTAAGSFDRVAYGFTDLPKVAEVRFESSPRDGYDAMLHIDGRTSRTISFRTKQGIYVWTGEQEILKGPRWYETVDGTFNETIILTYEVEETNGVLPEQMHVGY